MIPEHSLDVACDAYDLYNQENQGFLLRGQASGQAMRKALEAYEKSKWIKFDKSDESTYPQTDIWFDEYLVFDNVNNSVNHDYWTPSKEWNHYNGWVTHYQPLPKFEVYK